MNASKEVPEACMSGALPHQCLSDQLKILLAKREVQCISISGPWGSGKTHCVRTVMQENWQDAAFASLFGIKSINNLKLTLLDNIVADQGGIRGWLAKRTKADRDTYGAAIEKLYSGAAIANDLALIAFRRVVRGKIIVLDDVERKHKDLLIDEIAGFIDELKDLSACRVIVVMNSERLSDHSTWADIREKVIDRELTFSPSPTQSAEIALPGHRLKGALSPLLDKCGITNIRAIKRIVDEIEWLDPKFDPNSSALHEFLAKFTLMMGSNLGALGKHRHIGKLSSDGTGSIKRDENFQNSCSTLLIESGGIFTDLIDQFLRSGTMPIQEINSLIKSKLANEKASRLKLDSMAFRNDFIWDIDWSDKSAKSECAVHCIEAAKQCDPGLMSHALHTWNAIGGSDSECERAIAIFRDKAERTRPKANAEDHFHPMVARVLESLNLLESNASDSSPDSKDERMRSLASGGFMFAAMLEIDLTQKFFTEQLQIMDAADMRYVVPTLLGRCESILGAKFNFEEGGEGSTGTTYITKTDPDSIGAGAFLGACRQYIKDHPLSKRGRLIKAALAGQLPASQEAPARRQR
ncbi:TPA: hypothetical protein UMT89_000793 [Stenotrophomonas maltophilia]|nr:hypothetical protein [Stenotrophomonas maltophilia]